MDRYKCKIPTTRKELSKLLIKYNNYSVYNHFLFKNYGLTNVHKLSSDRLHDFHENYGHYLYGLIESGILMNFERVDNGIMVRETWASFNNEVSCNGYRIAI